MKNKHIAMISYHTCPLADERNTEIGGMNIYVLELSKALAKKGYVIDIFTRCVDPNSPKIVQILPNLRVIHIVAGEQKSLPKKQLFKFIPEFTANLLNFTSQEKISYDLLSCHYYLSGLIGIELKKTFIAPMFVTFHTLALMKNLVARSEDEKEDIKRIEAEMLLMQKADHIVATSQKDAFYMHTLYNCPREKILILSPGVDLKTFHPIEKNKAKEHIRADKDHKLLLFAGRIEPLKGIDVLLYAIKILLERLPELDFCLWIVGGDISQTKDKWPKELQRLEEIRRVLNITTSVSFVGMKRQEELPYYYNAAEMLIMPSQYESFGITALESMACGTPVITTDVTGISGLFDKTHDALLTSASNPILLARKIRHLLVNEEDHARVSEEVLEKVQDLSWDNVAEKFSQFLEN